MKKMLFFMALAGATAASQALAAPIVRQPTGNWVVNFDDAQCVASRNFGTKEEPLFLVLKAPAIGDVVQVAVVRSGRGGSPQQLVGSISFDNREAVKTSVLAYTSGTNSQRIFTANLTNSDFAAAGKATTMLFTGAGQVNESFSLDKIASVRTVIGECVADLREVWNVSASEDMSPKLRQRARLAVKRLLSNEDYPDLAARKDLQGSVRFVLLVDESGRVADCTVLETSGVAALDAQGCSKIKDRARFTPAIGADGKPAKDAYTQRVRWMLPED